MKYIGIDLGTSAVKLLLMDGDGTVDNIISKEYPVSYPHDGWSEQNPEDWWDATLEGLLELTEDCEKDEVAGISFGGQMHGLVILDENDELIRPAILWNDGRTTKETDYLNKVIGKDRIRKYTGNIAYAGFTAPKLLWVANNEYENFVKIKKIMLPKDYIAYKLTGVFATDYSDASGTLLLDVENRCWSKEMLALCEITESQLPQLFESYEEIGTIKPDIAELLDLPEQTIVAAGAGDNAAAAVGTGCVYGGRSCNISIGTSGTVFISSAEFAEDDKNALHSFAHADGRYHMMGCMLSAASCNKWWMEEILQTREYGKEQADITTLGDNKVFFVPYLMGERCPHNDPKVRGAFVGLSIDTERKQMLQAVFEGVAYGLRDSLEIARAQGVEIDSATICGGGAKSELWKQIIANVLNLPVDTVEVEEGPAYGGAILAAVADGEYMSVREAVTSIVKYSDRVEPDEEIVAKYNQGYETFKKLYPMLKVL